MTTQRQYIALGGGLDTETAVLSVAPGFVREAWNFEQDVDGGYSRIAGFERFDGRPKPHLAVPADPLLVEDPVAIAAAQDARRALIQAVPGSGPVRGVFVFNDTVFAFRDAADGLSKALYKSTATGWVAVTTPTLAPGGSLETVVYNFGSGPVVFGCDGANKAFSFNGTTYTAITTGMVDDRPSHITAHQNHLFLSFGHSVQHSAIGDPTNWTPLLGAGEINVGAPVTNMVPQPGAQGSGALAISTAGSLFVLYGTSSANWSLITLQREVGARAGSMQNIGVAFMLGEMGVTIIGQSQEYGNFAHSVVSNRAKRWLQQYGENLTCSTIHHAKNQYRLFFETKGLFIAVRGREVAGMMPIDLPVSVSCVTTTDDDQCFFGGENGFVYQAEVGTSFDGVAIASLLVFPFNSNKSLRLRKRYRRLLIEMDSQSQIVMDASFSMAYGDTDVATVQQRGFPVSAWDVATWDSDYWDGGSSPIARVELEGSGENIAVALSHESRMDPSFSIRSFTLEFSPRRLER